MPNLSIKDVPESWAQALRQRAARHHRSLQGELMAIVEQAVGDTATARQPLRTGWKTADQIALELRARHPAPPPGVPLAADTVRAERDAR